MSYLPIAPGASSGPPAARRSGPWRWASVGGTVFAVAFAACASLVAAALSYPGTGPAPGLALLSMLVGLAQAGLLVLRRRYAVVLTLTFCATAIVLPLDSFAALLCLTWVIASARVRTAVLCTTATAAATAVALARDFAREPIDRVFAVRDQATGVLEASPGALAFWIGGILLIAAAVGAGLARRFRTVADESHVARDHAVAALQENTVRQDEREAIAREVHDTVAHHIATIAMQASAFEVTQDDPMAKDAARQVRSSAQQAIGELRALITSLRSGEMPGVEGANLADLVPLLDRLRDGGLALTSSVFVTDPELASEALARATFRIVQESLTNALKHAPGAPVTLAVRASRSHGVEIRVTNPVHPDMVPAPGTSTGLVGMAERCNALGGQLTAGIDTGTFVVTARLPWSDRVTSPSTA